MPPCRRLAVTSDNIAFIVVIATTPFHPARALSLAAVGCGGSSAAVRPQRRPREAHGPHRAPRPPIRSSAPITVTGTLAAEEQVTLSLKCRPTRRAAGRPRSPVARVRRWPGSRRPISTSGMVSPTPRCNRRGRGWASRPRATMTRSTSRHGARAPGRGRCSTKRSRQRERIAVLRRTRLAAAQSSTRPKRPLKVAEGRYQDALEEVRNRQAILAQRRSGAGAGAAGARDTSLRRRSTASSGSATPRCRRVSRRRHAGRHSGAHASAAAAAGGARAGRRRAAQSGRARPGRRRCDSLRRPRCRLSPAIDRSSRTLLVEAEVPNHTGQLRPGSFANADIVTATEQALLVPASALVDIRRHRQGARRERRQGGGTARSTGRAKAIAIEILEGLAAGDVVDRGSPAASPAARRSIAE